MDDNARALHHERITLLSGMVQELRREVARLQADLDTARDEQAQLRIVVWNRTLTATASTEIADHIAAAFDEAER